MLGVLLWEFAEVGMQASDPRERRLALNISGTTHWTGAQMKQGRSWDMYVYILALPSKLFTTLIMQQLSKSAIKTNECIAGYVKPQSTFQRRKNFFCMRIWMKKTAMNINDNWPMILQSCNPYIVGIFSAGLQCLVCSRDQCLVLQPWWMSTYIPLLHGTASSHIGLAYCALKCCKNVYVTNFHKFFT